MDFLVQHFDDVLLLVLTLLQAAKIVVRFTETKVDDKVVDRMYQAVFLVKKK